MFRKAFSRLCCLFTMLVVFQSCASKSDLDRLAERYREYESQYEYGYIPPRPYESVALMDANLSVKDLEGLLDLIEERLNAPTLNDYLAIEAKIDEQLSRLFVSICPIEGAIKYGRSFDSLYFVRINRRVRDMLHEFSRIRTPEELAIARQVIFDTEVQIQRELNSIDW